MANIQITIDTNKDSPEQIEKAIQLLSSLTDPKVRTNSDIFSNINSTSSSLSNDSDQGEKQPSTGGVFNMFSNKSPLISKDKDQEKDISNVQIMKY